MYKFIINGTYESECSSFEERFDGLEKTQNLTINCIDTSSDFAPKWKKVAENSIESIEFQYDGQSIVTYTKEQYNLIQMVIVRAMPESASLEGTVVFTHRIVE